MIGRQFYRPVESGLDMMRWMVLIGGLAAVGALVGCSTPNSPTPAFEDVPENPWGPDATLDLSPQDLDLGPDTHWPLDLPFDDLPTDQPPPPWDVLDLIDPDGEIADAVDLYEATDTYPDADQLPDETGQEILDSVDLETDLEPLPQRLPGEPCTLSEQCTSNSCQDTPFGRFCLLPCDAGCPDGWECDDDPEQAMCRPVAPLSCWPCKHTFCPDSWCHPLGIEGEFCLSACLLDQQCPPQYSCQGPEDGLKFCRPPIPGCACKPSQIGNTVACKIENEFGSCMGSGLCTVAGLLKCEGPVPQFDLCDGLDNNCDGIVDEPFPLKGTLCDGPDDDQCMTGLWTCHPDGSQLVCSGEKPQIEICDNQDNDCDGLIDEEFPEKGSVCGISPFCGTGYWACDLKTGKLKCKGVTPEPEECDGIDNDCDGLVDEDFPDIDGDGIADCA